MVSNSCYDILTEFNLLKVALITLLEKDYCILLIKYGKLIHYLILLIYSNN